PLPRTCREPFSRATTEGSSTTTPSPCTATSVLAVPRSMPTSGQSQPRRRWYMGKETSEVRGQTSVQSRPPREIHCNLVGELPASKLSEVTVVGIGEESNVG